MKYIKTFENLEDNDLKIEKYSHKEDEVKLKNELEKEVLKYLKKSSEKFKIFNSDASEIYLVSDNFGIVFIVNYYTSSQDVIADFYKISRETKFGKYTNWYIYNQDEGTRYWTYMNKENFVKQYVDEVKKINNKIELKRATRKFKL